MLLCFAITLCDDQPNVRYPLIDLGWDLPLLIGELLPLIGELPPLIAELPLLIAELPLLIGELPPSTWWSVQWSYWWLDQSLY